MDELAESYPPVPRIADFEGAGEADNGREALKQIRYALRIGLIDPER